MRFRASLRGLGQVLERPHPVVLPSGPRRRRGSARSEIQSLVVTRRLGRYHLVEPIGGGPTGEVHRARVYGVAGFERQFAVKRFHPEIVANPNIAARLSVAARAYGGLEHPRIARLFEYGVAGGETFTACELV